MAQQLWGLLRGWLRKTEINSSELLQPTKTRQAATVAEIIAATSCSDDRAVYSRGSRVVENNRLEACAVNWYVSLVS